MVMSPKNWFFPIFSKNVFSEKLVNFQKIDTIDKSIFIDFLTALVQF